MKPRLLIVDDDPSILESLVERFEAREYSLQTAADGEAAVAAARGGVDVILLDLQLPGGDGLWVLGRLAAEGIEATVVVITAHGTVGRAVDAMKAGAYDFLEKPFEPARVEEAVGRAWERARLLRTNRALRGGSESTEFVFADPAMERLARQAERAAGSSATVLLLGESGTGKEVLARALHGWSPRQDGPFVAVNCAALSESLLESELFGHEKGAFTGATGRREGKFEASSGGTLFLDEIGDTTPGFQKKLLRVLQEHRFERVGGNQTIEIDLRCVAATNRDLKKLVAEGSFREDLYYRLNVIALELPPLRERAGDIERLAEHFVELFAKQLGRPGLSLLPEARAALLAYPWPGNIRELRNVMERAAVLAEDPELGVEELPPEFVLGAHWALDGETAGEASNRLTGFHERVELYRRQLLASALAEHEGNQTRAAEALGLQRSYLARLLKKYGLLSG